ncbi:MAG TPA: VanZ family protein [Thermoanaerobaculia bacterium]|nr:VanZ family protein [Thermoanaerobaculia bacterium]
MSPPRIGAPVELALRVIPVLLYLVFTWMISATPGDRIPAGFDDRIAHFGEYALLAFLMVFAMTRFDPARTTARPLVSAALLSAAWGVVDEWHQSWIPGRDSSLKDLGFDALGAVAACAVVGLLAARERRSP